MRRATALILLVCIVSAGALPALGVGTSGRQTDTDSADAAANNATNVTILSYNDIQTAAAKDGNLPRLVHRIDERRAAHDNPTFVMGGGDELSPHALSPVSKWHAPVDVLNRIGPDADTIGNHDLDYGTDEFANASRASDFPWVASNLVNETTGEPIEGAKPYEVVEKDGVKVGVVGAIYPGVDGSVSENLSANGITAKPVVPSIRKYERVLREKEDVDVMVVLLHEGTNGAETVAKRTDTDVVLTGHDEVVYRPRVVDGTIISETRARAEFLSEINLTVEDGDVVAANGRLLNITDSTPKNETASDIINGYRAEVDLDSTIAYSETPLDARFATNYHRESNYGDLVTDAMRARTGADVAITNAGGIRSDGVYGPGNITGGDVFNTLPFGNTVVTVELTGSELEETLASQITTLESEAGQQYGAEMSMQVSGVGFEWVGHEGRDHIRDVTVNGEPVDPNATYEVAVNSFMKGGGDGYPLVDKPVVQRTDELISTVVVDYLKERGRIAPTTEGRIQRVDTTLDDASVRLDEHGKVVMRFDAPEDYDGTVADSFVISTPDDRTVAAEKVTYDAEERTLAVRFDDAELAALLGCERTADLDLYGSYSSSKYDQVYFNHSRLNADVTATLGTNGEQQAANETNETNETNDANRRTVPSMAAA
ncbi:5'-nucleotidase C-terminal domain-containing protein [Haladaptatus sp. DYF46]|uniref:bifunctional metallophosphatase/5'-nucleotidase n=1 Tax=Haladaptatus sp. DYF46 TaxID=2886041 RepID=UPI001E3EAC27|nr:5'-nucleotidase C-terminal domain-containing protein [Haladaptatus sp. DYF46]